MSHYQPYRHKPMYPRSELSPAHRTTLCYRYVSPVRAVNIGFSATAHNPLPTANSLTYTFSTKERDTETGYSYFGSRYYSSDLSIWLSVDPQASKYPSLSPYVYCANNPVRLVDPNGEEIYEFDENGKFLRTSGDKGSPDQIAIIRSDGTKTMSRSYEHGTISLGLKGSVNQKDGSSVDIQSLKIKGDDQALECFKFVADNSTIEWSLVRTGSVDGKKGTNYLSNSQEFGHNSSTKLLNGTGLLIREHWHSHPNGIMIPSKEDYDAHNKFFEYGNIRTDITGYVPTFIYSHGKQRQYSPFLKMLENNINEAWNEWKQGK